MVDEDDLTENFKMESTSRSMFTNISMYAELILMLVVPIATKDGTLSVFRERVVIVPAINWVDNSGQQDA